MLCHVRFREGTEITCNILKFLLTKLDVAFEKKTSCSRNRKAEGDMLSSEQRASRGWKNGHMLPMEFWAHNIGCNMYTLPELVTGRMEMERQS